MNTIARVVLAYFLGGIPFSNIVARWSAHTDLRDVANGTVSGTSLYRVGGFMPLVIAGVLDVCKGVAAPLLAGGNERPVTAALAAGAAVAGHNWSPFLLGAGGRGISVALGSTLVLAWPATLALGLGLAVGRLLTHTGLGCFVALVALVPLLLVTDGATGLLLAVVLVVPILLKRVVGNGRPQVDDRSIYLRRLLFDRDDPAPSSNGRVATT